MPKKQKTIKDLIQNMPPEPEVPFDVYRFLGSKNVSLFDHQVSFGEGDYASVEQMQEAIEWYVQQFGGAVKW